ncbi:TPA: hypothetical protein JHJ76_004433 [Escherichia coli]|uniref:hypothetical protein n=1 Tax=Brucella intermedia TaxID=94625 RepID=UPI00224B8DC8|nr:hypothetical protein [Brucella intermedia]HAV2068405.1 hypothetical protein [Escherichia coli]
MFELFLFLGVALALTVAVGAIRAYAGLWHWLLDLLDARRQRRAILRATQKDRDRGGR